MWLEEVFKTRKPVIAMLHLDALPGDVRWRDTDTMETVLEHARMDLHALQEGGVDGVLISNEFSLPYEAHVEPVNVAAMAYVIGALRNEFTVPFGVDCIGDGASTIDLAAVTGAQFVREGFSGAHVGLNGINSVSLTRILKRRKELGAEHVRMLYFLNPESDQNLNARPYDLQARSLIFEAFPDGLCVSANGAGMDVDEQLLRTVKQVSPDTAVLCNTGCRPDTIRRKLTIADAAVVGTYFKDGGRFMDEQHRNVRVDKARVKELMDEAVAFRKGC